jgi:hypothetical protein
MQRLAATADDRRNVDIVDFSEHFLQRPRNLMSTIFAFTGQIFTARKFFSMRDDEHLQRWIGFDVCETGECACHHCKCRKK